MKFIFHQETMSSKVRTSLRGHWRPASPTASGGRRAWQGGTRFRPWSQSRWRIRPRPGSFRSARRPWRSAARWPACQWTGFSVAASWCQIRVPHRPWRLPEPCRCRDRCRGWWRCRAGAGHQPGWRTRTVKSPEYWRWGCRQLTSWGCQRWVGLNKISIQN